MAIDIFISYAREDYEKVKEYFDLLKSNDVFSPWMDKVNIPAGGQWEKRIYKAMKASDVIICFLSNNIVSVDRFFHKEKQFFCELMAKNSDLLVVPALLENCKIPAELDDINAVPLFENDGWDKVVSDILSDKLNDNRSTLKIRGGTLQLNLPCFFPSISSIPKSHQTIIDYLELFSNKHLFGGKNFLISAYDLHETINENGEDKVTELIDRCKDNGSVILLDSGNYETYWIKKKYEKSTSIKIDKDFWDKQKLSAIINKFKFDMAFGFDNVSPPIDPQEVIAETELWCVQIRNKAPQNTSILPIIHANEPKDLPHICKEVVERLSPLMIAIPERKLGNGIYERALTVKKVRDTLCEIDSGYVPIHILGTGSPIPLMIYSFCGANSFDGLEWCMNIIDYDHLSNHHPHLGDYIISDKLSAIKDITLKMYFHNLMFYQNWMEAIQHSISTKNYSNMLTKHLPQKVAKQFMTKLPEVFE